MDTYLSHTFPAPNFLKQIDGLSTLFLTNWFRIRN